MQKHLHKHVSRCKMRKAVIPPDPTYIANTYVSLPMYVERGGCQQVHMSGVDIRGSSEHNLVWVRCQSRKPVGKRFCKNTFDILLTILFYQEKIHN